MMHSLVFAVPPKTPTNLAYTVSGPTNNRTVNLTWTDNSIKEAGFVVQRASNAGFTTGLTSFNVAAAANSGSTVNFADTTVANNTAYWYRVYAIGNVVGDTQAYANSVGFPTMNADSVSAVLPVTVGTPTGALPANPTLLTTTVLSGPSVRLTWRDNATNETGFEIERCTGARQAARPGPRSPRSARETTRAAYPTWMRR